MPIRDIVVTAIIAGILPFAAANPFVGIALWTWLSVMNPHRLTWGFAYNLPFAMLAALATLFSLVVAGKNVKFPVTPLTVALIAFMAWMSITFVFAIHFSESFEMWSRVTKMLFMTLVAFAVVRTEKHIRILLWIFVMSVAFYGIKGGVFTIATAGQSMVWGPMNSQIADNNAISLALVMMIPLMAYLYHQIGNSYLKVAMVGSIVLCIISVLGTYSRTAFVACAAMLMMLVLKSRRAILLVLAMVMALPVILVAMPQRWWDRMATIATGITTGHWDGSVQGRFNAWMMAWNLAKDRPIVGGGFAVYEPDVFAKYAPNPLDIHSAHSNYFQVLGEHGFVGLALFLLVGVLGWRVASRVIRKSRSPDVLWRANLARALQVSMVGFFVGGLAVNIAYWDVYYFELVLLVALDRLAPAENPQRVVQAPATSRMSEFRV